MKEIISSYKIKEKKTRIFGENFVKNNKNNCKLYMGGKEYELTEFYETEKIKEKKIL